MSKISDALVRLERRVGRSLDRLTRRKGAGREPFEVVPAILDDVEDRVEPTGGGGRVFPYNRLAVTVRVDPSRRAAAEAVFAHGAPLVERIRERLAATGCEAPADLDVSLRFDETPLAEGEPDFTIDYRRRATSGRRPEPAAAPPSRPPTVQVHVVAGRAERKTMTWSAARIEVGRLKEVEDRARGRVRRNDLAFVEDEADEINRTVSRAHAHLEYDPSTRDLRLYDDGSVHGTRVLRAGRTLDVPRRGRQGVRVQSGDELQFGRARVQIQIREST